jgi:MFS family permease
LQQNKPRHAFGRVSERQAATPDLPLNGDTAMPMPAEAVYGPSEYITRYAYTCNRRNGWLIHKAQTMTPTILTLLGGLGVLLAGIGLLGTLLGVRATTAAFNNLEIGLIMGGYYAGYIMGTLLVPRLIRNVGHVRCFAAFAAMAAAASLGFGLLVDPLVWLVLRVISGICVVGIYMVVESWLNEQSAGPSRGRTFSFYMMSTLLALGAGQFLLLTGNSSELTLFALAAIFISLGVVPIAITRVTEPRIELIVPVKLSELFRVSPLGMMGALSAGVVNGAFWGMAPVFGQRLGLGDGGIALLMSATILGGVLLQWPIGHLSDRIDRRTVLILTSFATALASLVIALIALRGYPGLIPGSFIYGGLMFTLYSISVAHTNDHLGAGQVLEATRSLLLVYGIGALFGPILGGVAMQGLGPPGLPAMAALTALVLALFGIFRVTRRAAPALEEQAEFVPMVRTTPVALEMYPEADQEPELDLENQSSR